MPENKLTFRNCIRELLGFVRPYRIRLSIALFMIIVTNLTFALNPMMEGKITTQLASAVSYTHLTLPTIRLV